MAKRYQRFSSSAEFYKNISADHMRSMLIYDPITGVVTRIKRCGRFLAGSIAGTVNRSRDKPYMHISIHGHNVRLHKVIWLLHYGQLPTYTIDHIDGDSLNNRIDNLRDVPLAQNNKNLALSTKNKSGRAGIEVKCAPGINFAYAARSNGEVLMFFTPKNGWYTIKSSRFLLDPD